MLVIAGRQGFQRLYDLPERVLPDAVLGAPVPDEDEVLRAVDRAGGARPRRADRARGRRALRGCGAGRPGSARTPTRWSRRASCDRPRWTTAALPVLVPADADPDAQPHRRPCCSRRSTTCSGTGRSPSACSASAT